MFEDLKDRINRIKDSAGKLKAEELKEMLLDIGRYEQIKSLQDISYLNQMINDLSRKVERIDTQLMDEDINDEAGLIKRKGLQAEKRAILQLLQYFQLPDISYIEETLHQYE